MAASTSKSTSVWSELASGTQWTLAVACPSERTSGSISSGEATRSQSRSSSYGETSDTTKPVPSSSHQPSHGSAWACSARCETTVRCPWCSKASVIASSVTTRLGAATLPCFIDRTTSSCSASVRPSMSSE